MGIIFEKVHEEGFLWVKTGCFGETLQ
jgi:hypothetical protein